MADKDLFLHRKNGKADVKRSTYDLSHTSHLTARFGRIYPVLVEEMLPHSFYKIRPRFGFDLMPMVFPTQSRIRCHLAFFKVPFRIMWENYTDFESRVDSHTMPYISRPVGWCEQGSLADYMGVPTNMYQTIEQDYNVPVVKKGYLTQQNWMYVNTSGAQCGIELSSSLLDENYSYSVNDGSYRVCVGTRTLRHHMVDGVLHFGFTTPVLSGNGVKGRPLTIVLQRSPITPHNVEHDVTTRVEVVDDSNITEIITQTAVYKPYVHKVSVKLSQGFFDAVNRWVSESFNVRIWIVTNLKKDELNLFYTGRVPYRAPHLSTQAGTPNQINKIVEQLYEVVYSFDYVWYRAKVDFSVESLNNPFCKQGSASPKLPINALPFRAYEMIYNYHFRNRQVDPFMVNGKATYNKFLTNMLDGADSTTPVDFKQCLFEYDQFTTALPNPQAGVAPLVGVSVNDNTAVLKLAASDGTTEDVVLRISSDGYSVEALPQSRYAEIADKTGIHRLDQLINAGISINDLRNVDAFHRMLERYQRTDFQYEHVVEEFFGATPPTGENYPVYVGGYTRDVSVGKIENVSSSDEEPLGKFAGVGSVSSGGVPTIKCGSSERAYLMGLMWFTVTPTYMQALPKHFLKRELLDYFTPALANIGPQPIYKNEIAPLQLDVDKIDEILGYQTPWYEYKSRFDTAHGEFRGSLHNYLIQRIFATAPDLSPELVNMRSEDLTNIFANLGDTDKLFGAIRFDMQCTSPVPRHSVPKIV